jgi:hypothetical protein
MAHSGSAADVSARAASDRIPELICSDLGLSLAFYRLLGFTIKYSRPRERFAYLTRDGADLMLEQPATRDRLTRARS